jgi:hypothetical protein
MEALRKPLGKGLTTSLVNGVADRLGPFISVLGAKCLVVPSDRTRNNQSGNILVAASGRARDGAAALACGSHFERTSNK